MKTIGATIYRRLYRRIARIGHFLAWSELIWCIAQERRTLRGLSIAQLADIGVNPVDAQREANRSLLKIPDNRLRREN